MGFFDKLKFWKQEEPDLLQDYGDLESAFPTGGGPAYPTGIPESKSEDFGNLTPLSPTLQSPQTTATTSSSVPYQIVSQQPMYQPVQAPLNKDMEILSLKLDTIKNILDTINMRLEKLEHDKHNEYPMRQGKF